MKSLTPRPLALVLALLLITGAIVVLDTQLGATGATGAGSNAPPASAVERADTTPVGTGGTASAGGDFSERDSGQVTAPPRAARIEYKNANFERAKEIVNPSGFVNAENVSIDDYVGKKVILLEFWTYTCINCKRTLPYVNTWYGTYRNDGLIVIGVHTPEFSFEENRNNVKTAVEHQNIEYPVVLDNDYSTWNAYDQHYWPTRYLIDIDGFVRYKHIGEGAYGETDEEIRHLLAERDRVAQANARVENSTAT